MRISLSKTAWGVLVATAFNLFMWLVRPPDYEGLLSWAAGLFLFLACFGWILAHYSIPVRRSHPMIMAFVAIVGGALSVAIWLLVRPHEISEITAAPTQHPEQPPVPEITLTLRPSIGFFPVTIAPHKTIYIFMMNPKETQWVVYERSNQGKKPLEWPRKEELKITPGIKLPDQAMIYTFTNYSDKALVNIRMTFKLEFHQATKDKNHPGQVGSGALLSKHDHEVVLPEIPARGNAELHVVNQSAYFADYYLPEVARVKVSDEGADRNIKILRPNTGFLEFLPIFVLAPSNNRWTGIPD